MSAAEPPVIVIMAGGSGERFWPLSNRTTPKQLLRMHGDKTMLEAAFDRAARLVSADRVYISAGERLRDAIHSAVAELKTDRYIAEPFARDTAGCLGLAACTIESRHGGETVMGVLTADHVIEEGPVFDHAVRAAMKHAGATDELVTLGIQPTYPDTAFGYLEVGERIAEYEIDGDLEAIRRVVRFTEKPDQATAERFLAEGRYLWNSGMFFWKTRVLLEAFEAYQPEMAREWTRLRNAVAHNNPDLVNQVFQSIKGAPIDRAIMERSDRVATVVGQFGWTDIGSWNAFERMAPLDESGNALVGPSIVLDSSNNIIYNQVSGSQPAPEIVLHGVHDMVVVRTDKAILIIPKHRVQEVKSVVRHLSDSDRGDLV